MDFTSIILGLLLTAVIYLAFPLIKMLINDGKFQKESAHKIALWNSMVLGLIFCVIASASSNGNVTWNAAPAVLYYWINRTILTRKDADEAVHVNDKASSNTYPQGKPCVKQHIYFNKEQVVNAVEVRFCRKCGERLIDDGAFCHKCGTKKEKQANAVDEMQFCPKCGQKIVEGGIFCHKCGAEIVIASEEKVPTTDSVADNNFSGKPILLENGLVKCPACNFVQPANRTVCWQCSYKFDNEEIDTSESLSHDEEDEFESFESVQEKAVIIQKDDMIIKGSAILKKYIQKRPYVAIPNYILKIGKDAFECSKTLKGIVMHNGITDIGTYAFNACTNLSTVILSNSLTRLDVGTFSGCLRLSNIMIPASITYISEDAFENCGEFTIYTSAGSYAEQFANENNINVVLL